MNYIMSYNDLKYEEFGVVYSSPKCKGPSKSLLKWYDNLSDEYKDRLWGSKSGGNESDAKPSFSDISKAKACILAKAKASEASSKAKVKACGSKGRVQTSGSKAKVQTLGSKAKVQTSPKAFIVKSHVPITNFVLGLANAKTWNAILSKTFGVKIPLTMTCVEEKKGKRILWVEDDFTFLYSSDERKGPSIASVSKFEGPSVQGLLDWYRYNTIEEYLSDNYFPSTDKDITDKDNIDEDCIHESNFSMLKLANLQLQLAACKFACICSLQIFLHLQLAFAFVMRRTIDQSAGGKLRNLNAEESWALLEDLALYENESWNDPRDFAKPVKAIALPQDVPSTSDHRLIELENQICNGPHDTQYCMEDPEQAFVEYAFSRTDEAGDDDEPQNEGPNEGEGVTMDGPAVAYFDTFLTKDELTYHKYLMCGPIPSIFLRNPIIMERYPLNLKIPCNIGHVHVEKAYIDLNSPLNIMTRMMYNWIMRRKLNPREDANRGVINFTGRIKGMHVFIGNFTYIMDFMIIEDISSEAGDGVTDHT
ncbi:hypothetical protein Tco_1055519 [Tanacetum coccineum]|uniref:MAK10-like protein n=1 Tax=Tanacetum coccineum TaxID=301880 RepID=A0ABQ5H1Q3_9ASTR